MKIDLRLGGEIIPLYFGMVAFEEMQKLLGVGYAGANKYAVDVVWSGYINNCAVESIYPIFTHQMLYMKFEELFFNNESDNNVDEIMDAFEKSKAGTKLFEEVDKQIEVLDKLDEELKKKMTAKNSPTKKLKK